MQFNNSILIFGPDQTFNSALIVELGRRELSAQAPPNDVATLRTLAREQKPDVIFLDCHLIEGWGFDLLYALIKLFPKSLIFLCAKNFALNRAALHELGIECFVKREVGLPVIVNQLLECHKQFKAQNTNVS